MSQVPRLSIVIPCRQADKHFEDTLVSVLQNRPADCEVLVTCRGAYDDPYDLSSEVRFVSCANDASLCRLVNIGFQQATGTVVHSLQCGLEVAEDWWVPALGHFENPSVAAVSPLILATRDAASSGTAGIAYDAGGRCRESRSVSATARQHAVHPGVLGPTLLAGFYRRQVIDQLHGLDERLGETVADVDLGLRLRQHGCTAVFEPECQIRGVVPCGGQRGRYAAGRAAEFLFWKHAAAHGWFRSTASHAMLVGGEVAAALLRPGQLMQLLGRASAVVSLLLGARRIRSPDATGRIELERSTRGESNAVAVSCAAIDTEMQRHVA
jgi:hypothetical protein